MTMARNTKDRAVLKIVAIVAIASLIFMGFTFVLAPNEGAESEFVLKLKDGEDKVKMVQNATGHSVNYTMDLYHKNPNGEGDHVITLEIVNITYSGGSTASNWSFKFNTTKLKDGEYRVTAIAKDNKGKLGDAHIWIIVNNTIKPKENQEPIIKITQPSHNTTVKGEIKISLWDFKVPKQN